MDETTDLGLFPAMATRYDGSTRHLLRVDGLTSGQVRGLKELAARREIPIADAVPFRQDDGWCEGLTLDIDLEGLRRLAGELGHHHASVARALSMVALSLEERVPTLRFASGEMSLYPGADVTLMGILNVTPDSFSDGGRFVEPAAAVEHAQRMVAEGAGIIDVGGESTRPGADPVPADEEGGRVVPVIEKLREVLPSTVILSVDTMKAAVAREAVGAGAEIINDVSALTADPEMPAVVAETGAHVILNHMRGTPRTMQAAPEYRHVIPEVVADLTRWTTVALRAGVDHEKILIDPGFGFGKRRRDNAAILRHLPAFASLGRPLVVGLSRKSFLGTLSPDGGGATPARAETTLSAETLAVLGGAHILRTHDPERARRAARVAETLMRSAGVAEGKTWR